MKKLIIVLCAGLMLTSCAVQQFPVNTSVTPFQYGGKAFGEKTKGKEVAKGSDIHVIGINVSPSNSKSLAESIKADSYTIETKYNLVTGIVYYVTFGLVSWKQVKVIKR